LPPLPTPLTSFAGRDQELADVRQSLAHTRLLTLTGVGGIGKTRLALEAARQAQGDVAFVELAAVASVAAMPHAVASALGVREQPQRLIIETLAILILAIVDGLMLHAAAEPKSMRWHTIRVGVDAMLRGLRSA